MCLCIEIVYCKKYVHIAQKTVKQFGTSRTSLQAGEHIYISVFLKVLILLELLLQKRVLVYRSMLDSYKGKKGTNS